eukprot:gene13474-19334_t
MAPLPPIWDPAKAADKLPQPFRMIDKIVSEIIELALDEIGRKAEHRKWLKTINTNTNFAPHAVLVTDGEATCFATLGVAGLAVSGLSNGGLVGFSARDNTLQGTDNNCHTSAISAMDSGHVSATSSKVVVSASAGNLSVHDVIIKTAELITLAKTELPQDPDDPGAPPSNVFFSPNSAHIAAPSDAVAGNQGKLSLVVHFPVAVVRKLLTGCSQIGPVNIVWQLQQRPDKSGRSDRYHKPAKGCYIWWHGCNKLALSTLNSMPVPELGAAPPTLIAEEKSAVLESKPGTPLKGTSKPTTPKVAAKGGKGAPAEAPPVEEPNAGDPKPADKPGKGWMFPHGITASGNTEDGNMLIGRKEALHRAPPVEDSNAGDPKLADKPGKGWMFPHGITATGSTEDGTMLAFGLSDGSVLIWDDTTGCHTKILKRLPSPVCALAYVNGTAIRLFVTSTDGSMHVANLGRPEDSYTATVKLPYAAHTVYFLPNDPFAFIILKGITSHSTEEKPSGVEGRPPRFYWYHMVEQKLVAECTGKDPNNTFGTSGLLRQPGMWPQEPKPFAAAEPAPEPPAKGKGAKGAAPPPPPLEAEESQRDLKPIELDSKAPPVSYPRWFLRDSYLLVGGPRIRSTTYRAPKGMLDEEVPDHEWPRESQMFLYKIDALARYLLPEELKSNSAKSMLDRMLAELNPIKKKLGKHVKLGVPDPDAPAPLPGVLKGKDGEEGKETDDDDDDAKSNLSGRKHIQFEDADGLFDEKADENKKIFKKETVKGGYSQKKDPNKDPNEPADPNKPEPVILERPKSPPWHHTNPLARIHPDWEEAQCLTRVMDRLGQKGGGRRRRDFNLRIANEELSERLQKEPGSKPRLLPAPRVKA